MCIHSEHVVAASLNRLSICPITLFREVEFVAFASLVAACCSQRTLATLYRAIRNNIELEILTLFSLLCFYLKYIRLVSSFFYPLLTLSLPLLLLLLLPVYSIIASSCFDISSVCINLYCSLWTRGKIISGILMSSCELIIVVIFFCSILFEINKTKCYVQMLIPLMFYGYWRSFFLSIFLIIPLFNVFLG